MAGRGLGVSLQHCSWFHPLRPPSLFLKCLLLTSIPFSLHPLPLCPSCANPPALAQIHAVLVVTLAQLAPEYPQTFIACSQHFGASGTCVSLGRGDRFALLVGDQPFQSIWVRLLEGKNDCPLLTHKSNQSIRAEKRKGRKKVSLLETFTHYCVYSGSDIIFLFYATSGRGGMSMMQKVINWQHMEQLNNSVNNVVLWCWLCFLNIAIAMKLSQGVENVDSVPSPC